MEMTGAKILMECLLEQGVDTGVRLSRRHHPERLRRAVSLQGSESRHILTAHEQGASHAADGYARSTGKVGVCLATSGPGATNLTTGIATAYMRLLPGGVHHLQRHPEPHRQGTAFQEVDITGICHAHHQVHLSSPGSSTTWPTRVREAFAIARTGRPGPVLIDIVKNVTAAEGRV